jgi:hypothetical protein
MWRDNLKQNNYPDVDKYDEDIRHHEEVVARYVKMSVTFLLAMMDVFIGNPELARIDTSHMFTDNDFTPEKANYTNYSTDDNTRVFFKRPCELVANPKFAVNGYNLDDIDQGSQGDCFLIAS